MPSNTLNVLGFLKPSNDTFSSGLHRTEDGFVSLNETESITTGSFLSSLDEDGLYSTQQLKVDWSKFQNHTFYQSARVKTNFAFQKIIEKYPFDGTKKELEEYMAKLSGWEKYVLDRFPKHKGYLWFSGSSSSIGGTYITVNDSLGAEYPDLTIENTGERRLSPMTSSFSIETFLFLPNEANENSVLIQKTDSTSGYMAFVSRSLSSTQAEVIFKITSASISNVVSGTISKNTWNHLSFDWNKERLTFSLNNNIIATSPSMPNIESIDSNSGKLFIGSGSLFDGFEPKTTLSGALDDLRVWFGVTRSFDERAKDIYTSVFAKPNLSLYFKFNEASGSTSSVVLDSSGKGMHGTLNTHAFSVTKVRNIATSSFSFGASPLIYENINQNPILFPDHPIVSSLRAEFLSSGSLYDDVNPSLITKLLPRHLFLEAQSFDNQTTEESDLATDLTSDTNTPRSTKLGGSNFLISLLQLWAKEFDELKLFTDALGTLSIVDYEREDTMPSVFLERYSRARGLTLPHLFMNASVEQYVDGTGITTNIQKYSEKTLREIQYQIWRRILTNLNDIIESKGTIHSIKSFFRAIGIDPDTSLYIREHGSGQKYSLDNSPKVLKTKSYQFLNFRNGGYVRSPILSSSRIEPGWPLVTSTANDNLLTSGSWTVEAVVNFSSASLTNNNIQSCVRLGGLNNDTTNSFVYANLLAISGSGFTLYVKPVSSSALVYSVSIAAPVENKAPWFVSFGRNRSDDTGFNTTNHEYSSYFLRVGQLDGEATGFFSSSHVFVSEGINSIFQTVSSSITGHTSGSFLEIGDNSTTATSGFLTSSHATKTFTGELGLIKFWSKALHVSESIQHSRNFLSFGSANPAINWNFDTVSTGSFQRMRLDANMQQADKTTSALGNINLIDFSQNNFTLTGSGFPNSTNVMTNKHVQISTLTYHLDDPATTNKVRVRGLEDKTNFFTDYTVLQGRAFEVPQFEQRNDSARLSIEFSAASGLNEDIMNLFVDMQNLSNILGDPTATFDTNYKGLEDISNIYFNRLVAKPNLKTFFEYYKWLDTNIGAFIAQLIPTTTTFNGINFIIESHILERARLRMHGESMFLGEENRNNLKRNLFLRQIAGRITR